MLTKNQRKFIHQLKKKKYRQQNNVFVAEGKKVIDELIKSEWSFESLYTTEKNFHLDAKLLKIDEMKKITHFKTPSPHLGIFFLPKRKNFLAESITIALDGVNDPGNLGTIIRMCDWFGLSEIICSSSTVDCFNSKVIQSSMGSITRVHCHYVNDLRETLIGFDKPIFGATTNGNSIYESVLPKKATYVFGNESHGISKSLSTEFKGEFSIPKLRKEISSPESLNVANASAIFLSELLRPN
tara:strand:- start:12293 stop:13015 length:723 start_codon:yes stop_codon:yes gene_type:complete